MIVDVLYEGLALAKGANAREEGKGAFVELEAPMPVGTRLTLRSESGERLARVERVQEGATSGVEVRFLDASAAATSSREAAAPSHVEPVEAERTVREEPRDPS